MASREKSFFWASYADLMTSLFFVMLTLFIIAIVALNKSRLDAVERSKNLQAKIDKADELNNATRELDSKHNKYFQYYPEFKKHKIKVAVNFALNDASVNNLPQKTKEDLLEIGNILKNFVSKTIEEYPQIQYLLIIEGQSSKDYCQTNYELSYQRALSLKKYWEYNNIVFNNKNCEVLICGSGDGKLSGTGLMREKNQVLNQRFLIHILPKPGIIGDGDFKQNMQSK